LELKQIINKSNGGDIKNTLFNTVSNYAKSNPNAISGMFSNVISNVHNLPSLSSGLSNIAIIGFKTFLAQSPQYRQLQESGLMTPQNEEIMFELLKLEISHLIDPSFYPIILNLIKNIVILAGSAESFNPVMVLSALKELYNILNIMKTKYPKDFYLLSTFLINNKDKIFYQLRSNGMRFPGLETEYNIFLKLISIPMPQEYQQQPQMNYPQQQPQMNYQQQQPQINYQQQQPQMNYSQQPQMNYPQQPQMNYPQQPQMNYQQPLQMNY
jgi:hypothetical protein